jgi:hypothetical protein
MLGEDILLVFEIHLAEDVLQAIANDEVGDLELQVVGGNLVENMLSDSHIGAFVFHDDERIAIVVVDDRVATLG